MKQGEQPYWCDNFVWSLAQRTEAMTDISKEKRPQALMHLAYMFALQGMGRVLGEEEEAVGKLVAQSCPESLAIALVKRFSETQVENSRSKQVRTPDMEDKLCLYMAAMALNLGQYTTDLNLFADTLKMQGHDARKYFMALGCKSSAKRSAGDDEDSESKATAGTFMSLKLPLKFPDPPRRMRGK